MIADDRAAKRCHNGRGPARVADQQQRCEIGIDGELDPLRTLVAISEATDCRRLADADDAVAIMQSDEAERLPVHRCHREDMRTDRGHIHDDRLDALNGYHICSIPQWSAP